MIILGIETSCDETAAALVKDGSKILSSVVTSQIAIHQPFGGIVPELASRKHIETITPVVNEAFLHSKITKKDVNAIAVTQGPGLVGSLLVGFSFAKAFSFALNIPCIGINHLEGHICSIFLEKKSPLFPFVALIVSGGHTNVYHVLSHTEYELMGRTRDDAAGEAYDKVAKMLGLGYPGGRVIDELAADGDPYKIIFPKPYLNKDEFDFSFSGLKTAVNRYIQTHKDEYKMQIKDIAAGFQRSVIEVLSYKIVNAAIQKKCNYIIVAGGVAANKGLRDKVTKDASKLKKGLSVYFPSVELCTDNAAMIAAAGYHYYIKKEKFISLDDDVYSRNF
mmetsp:Transcript_5845/g.3324  ORF Transcript_5845/g.3324 Transcript_5845/m.3324 type:complete len:335 (-) Transcript_5845:1507-2511(-)